MPRSNFPSMGFGCINLKPENSNIIDAVIKTGHFFDTADCYGGGLSEKTLGTKLKNYDRSQFIVCTKVGVKFSDTSIPKVQGDRKYIKYACQQSLNRLQLNYIDVLQLHRTDPKIPIEESMQAFKELIEEGKIRGIGLSEVTADQIKRAYRIHPLDSVQIEYSPWSRHDEENEVIKTCQELDIAIIACSPIGRAMFTNTDLDFFAQLPHNDYRTTLPRYQNECLKANIAEREPLLNFANKKKCTLAQLVLAWEMKKGLIPIPGTTKLQHFFENAVAQQTNLSEDEFIKLEKMINESYYHGPRYLNEKYSAIYSEKRLILFWNKYKRSIFGASLIGAAGLLACLPSQAVI